MPFWLLCALALLSSRGSARAELEAQGLQKSQSATNNNSGLNFHPNASGDTTATKSHLEYHGQLPQYSLLAPLLPVPCRPCYSQAELLLCSSCCIQLPPIRGTSWSHQAFFLRPRACFSRSHTAFLQCFGRPQKHCDKAVCDLEACVRASYKLLTGLRSIMRNIAQFGGQHIVLGISHGTTISCLAYD